MHRVNDGLDNKVAREEEREEEHQTEGIWCCWPWLLSSVGLNLRILDTGLSALYQISFISVCTGHKSAFYDCNNLLWWKSFLTPGLKVISPWLLGPLLWWQNIPWQVLVVEETAHFMKARWNRDRKGLGPTVFFMSTLSLTECLPTKPQFRTLYHFQLSPLDRDQAFNTWTFGGQLRPMLPLKVYISVLVAR